MTLAGGGAAVVVYADEAFALNALLDLLLLRASARVGGVRCRLWRLMLGAAVGGVYAAACCWPALALARCIPAQLLALAAMTVTAFGVSRRALWQGALLLALAFALCGALTAAARVLGARLLPYGAGVCYALDFPSLVLASGAAFGLTALCFSGLGGHSGGDIVPAQASLFGKSVRFSALRDTGNTLRDPVTGAPVLTADIALARELLPPDAAALVTAGALRDPAALLAGVSRACPRLRMRLIPYSAVGVHSALLLAVRCDELTIAGEKQPGALMALSPTDVSDGGAYQALTGGN